MLTGTVLAQEANFYRVRPVADSGSAPETLLCTRRARLKKTGQLVYVGDEVEIVEVDWQSGRGAIASILPRRSLLARPPIANCTGVLVVSALTEPPHDPVLLSRFLVCIEAELLAARVCLTKADGVGLPKIEAIEAEVRSWGYAVSAVSASANTGTVGLALALSEGAWVLAGVSGAGKSSLLNALKPGLELRVSTISERVGRGRHTTRHVELFELPGGALIADAPGFSQLELTFAPEDLAHCFPEFRPLLGKCQFRDCLHRDEPECAVRAAGLGRYPIYRTFLEEVAAHAVVRRRTTDLDEAVKSLDRATGKTVDVPRLGGKYREPSRHTTRQELKQWDPEAVEEE